MQVDFLIVGQGLAGSALALALRDREKKVLVVDRQDAGSSSRVAAGLITPLTGKGMNPAWRQREYLDSARQYYHELENVSGRRFFYDTAVLRLLLNAKERQKWEQKRGEYGMWARDVDEPGAPLKRHGYGAVEMPEGAWLDTMAYLDVVRDILIKEQAWCEASFVETDVLFSDKGIRWRDVVAQKVILCQGVYGLSGFEGYNGWFRNVAHRSAKGEILTLNLEGLDTSKRYHCGGWLAPRHNGVWKAGASYEWETLNSEPTALGRSIVLEKLGHLLSNESMTQHVIAHEAGVRPIIRNSRPVVGFHPELPQVGFFNGLGSKGALMAPAVARHFADHLCGLSVLDKALTMEF